MRVTGNMRTEAVNINLSLHFLEQVIVALHQKAKGLSVCLSVSISLSLSHTRAHTISYYIYDSSEERMIKFGRCIYGVYVCMCVCV